MVMNCWIYSDERMALRAQVIGDLFKTYGGEQIQNAPYSTEDIYSAAHDWVSHGNRTAEGVLEYFNTRFIENGTV